MKLVMVSQANSSFQERPSHILKPNFSRKQMTERKENDLKKIDELIDGSIGNNSKGKKGERAKVPEKSEG
jgi:hypothetical protein